MIFIFIILSFLFFLHLFSVLTLFPSPVEHSDCGKCVTTLICWGIIVALCRLAFAKIMQGLGTIREGRRSFIGTTSTPSVAMPAQRPASVPGVGGTLSRAWMTASMPSPVRMRESKPARKQRPASVASSMPSFVGGEPAKTPRSRSTDRTGRGTETSLLFFF